MRLAGKKNIRKEGDWMVDLSCFQLQHDKGMVIAFSFGQDGSYEGRVLEGAPQPDPDPTRARAQARWIKVMLDEAGETLECALSANLH